MRGEGCEYFFFCSLKMNREKNSRPEKGWLWGLKGPVKDPSADSVLVYPPHSPYAVSHPPTHAKFVYSITGAGCEYSPTLSPPPTPPSYLSPLIPCYQIIVLREDCNIPCSSPQVTEPIPNGDLLGCGLSPLDRSLPSCLPLFTWFLSRQRMVLSVCGIDTYSSWLNFLVGTLHADQGW
nr:hypothetical protein [Morchella crassipes]